VAACISAVDTLNKSDNLVKKLWSNTRFFQDRMKRLGYNIGITKTPITPVMIGDARVAKEFSQKLFDAGIFAQSIGFPTVPAGKARIRAMLSATHSEEDLTLAIDHFEKIGKAMKII